MPVDYIAITIRPGRKRKHFLPYAIAELDLIIDRDNITKIGKNNNWLWEKLQYTTICRAAGSSVGPGYG